MNNPVLRKELFMKFRLRQLSLSAKLGLLGVGLVALTTIYYNVIVRWIIQDTSSRSGYDAFCVVVGIEAVLIGLIAPVIAANSITQEKEQQTWEMLISTRLSPLEIIFGKLLARDAILILILILFAPIELFCWIKSPTRVSVSMLVLSYATLLSMTVFYSTFGLFMSWLLSRTLFAIMCAYTFVIGVLLVGTTLFSGILSTFLSSDFFTKCPLMWVNPALMMSEAMDPSDSTTTVLFLVYGLIVYVVLTVLILWRMTVGFRRFAHSR